jgi:hypothetical protein
MSLLLLFAHSGSSDVPVSDLDPLTRKTILVTFTDEIVTNDNYHDVSNYTLELVDGPGPVEIVDVLPVNGTSTLELVLVTQPMTLGTTYQLTANNLNDRNGATISFSGQFIYRDTKVDSALRSIPKHFDRRAVSIMHSIMAAIGKQDDLIGGSRSDRLVVESVE